MNAYDEYEFIKRRYGDRRKSPPEDYLKYLSDCIEAAEEEIRIYSGELFTFRDPAYVDKLRESFGKNPNTRVILTAGERVSYSDGLDECYMLRLFNGKSLANPMEIYYNHLNPREQIEAGYIHAVISDNGKTIILEKPHPDNGDVLDRERLFFENEPEIAELLCSHLSDYIGFYGIDDSLNETALKKLEENAVAFDDKASYYQGLQRSDFECIYSA